MAGGAEAVKSGTTLEHEVVGVAEALGLKAERQVKVGRRIWGAERRIDVVVKYPETNLSLGIECKYQGVGGSAEEKIPATIEDMRAWPIRGIVVFYGDGFTKNMEAYLHSTGSAMRLEDLEPWLKLYFGL